jgi:hypothetical protein
MLQSTRFLAMTLVLLVVATSQVEAQRHCPHCRKTHAAKRKQAPQGLQTARQKRQQREQDVRRVQHISPLQAQQMPPTPTPLKLAQNPLDDLQQEFEEPPRNTADDFLDDLEDLSDAFKDDSSPSDVPSQRDADVLDDVLTDRAAADAEPAWQDEGPVESPRRPLSALEDTPAGEEVDADVVAAEDAAAIQRIGPGLQSDAYYRALGAPKTARVQHGSQPLTMGDVFGQDDEYDIDCQRQYCRRVWSCAGGRNQNWLSRAARDFRRDRLVKTAGPGCLQGNNFKCPKVSQQQDACDRQGPIGAAYRGATGDVHRVYSDGTSVIADDFYDGQYPSSAEMPLPMVDET